NTLAIYDGKTSAEWRVIFQEEIEDNRYQNLKPSAEFPLRKHPDPAAVPVLVELLNDKDRDIRLLAVRCLGLLRGEAKPAVPGLTKALKDKNVSIRRDVALVLGNMGADAHEAVPQLICSLDDDGEAVVRECAARAIWNITGSVEIVVP